MEKVTTSSDSQDDIAIKSTEVNEEGPSIQIDPIAEKKLVRKLDLILLPMFCLICKAMVPFEITYQKLTFLRRLREFHRQVCFAFSIFGLSVLPD